MLLYITIRSAFKPKIKVKSQKVGIEARWPIRPALIQDSIACDDYESLYSPPPPPPLP